MVELNSSSGQQLKRGRGRPKKIYVAEYPKPKKKKIVQPKVMLLRRVGASNKR